MTEFNIVIPARYESTRLPGKPLIDICGKPLIQHVYDCAVKSNAAEIVIATDDKRILTACESFGADCVMTSLSHTSGTDRLAEVAALKQWSDETIIVNLQGDEPLIPEQLLDSVATELEKHPAASIETLGEVISDDADIKDPNCVKLVTDQAGYALYFSRSSIPGGMDTASGRTEYIRHIGLYAYRAAYLKEFSSTQPTPLEKSERLEQLRALEMGKKIHVTMTQMNTGIGVDTPEDLDKARTLICG